MPAALSIFSALRYKDPRLSASVCLIVRDAESAARYESVTHLPRVCIFLRAAVLLQLQLRLPRDQAKSGKQNNIAIPHRKAAV